MTARLVLTLALVGALAACSGSSEEPASSTSAASAPASSTPASSTPESSQPEPSQPVAVPTSQAPDSTLPPEQSDESSLALLGAYVEPRGDFGDDARRQAVLDHEAMLGRPLGLVNEFFRFDLEWAVERLQWHLDRGSALMISWNGAPAADILNGSSDDLIRERARWTRDLQSPVLLRFFWEPDAEKGDRWGYHDDPALYGEVWRYVRALFDEEGATNAQWMWTPTTWHFVTGSAPDFYPGDDVVDVIGADGYLWSPCQGAIESATDVFGAFLEWAADRPQPILIAEWGADADASAGSKATFIGEMMDLFGPMDRLLGLVVFDAVDPGGRGCDWRIDSDPSSLEAYRDLANDPRFAATQAKVDALG